MDVVANNTISAGNATSASSAANCDAANKNVASMVTKNKNGHGHSHQLNGRLNQTKDGTERKKPIRLQSPVGTQPITWNWSAEMAGSSIGIEVLDIIRLTICHYPEVDELLKGRLENVDVSNYDQVRSLAKKFNKVLNQTSQNRREGPLKIKSRELLHQIVTRCYNRAVDNEKALNKHYEAFSSQTYGETSFERMKMIIDELRPTEKDIFVDLGSGVGQLVIQVAGGSQVQKAVGIEIAKLPADFAHKLESEFKKLMNWFGRQFRPFELKHGDFLNEEYRNLITEEATIIFINNFAFQSDLEMRIKRELLSDLKQGTRIISTKPYVPLNKQGAITDRQLNDISVITDVVEMKACPNPCSWTSAYVPYYLHTINRKKLEMYFTLKNCSMRCKSSDVGSRRSSTPNSKNSNSRESSLGLREKSDHGRMNGEDICFGPTTRRKWHEYVNDLEQQKKRRGGAGSSTTPDERSVTNSSSSTPTLIGATVALASNSVINNPQLLPSQKTADNNPKTPLCELINSVKNETTTESSPFIDTALAAANAFHQETTNPLNQFPKFEPITPVTNNKNEGIECNTKKQLTKRNYERKDKMPPAVGGKRGRPSKADKMFGTHTSPKMPRLSDDAKDGMEVMHQMTLSVQGKSIDPASILADMAKAKQRSLSMDAADINLPFPNLEKTFINDTHSGRGEIHSQKYSERYPGLSKFLDQMRGAYENMFDEVYFSKQTATANDRSSLHANNSEEFLNAKSTITTPNNVQFRSILDQTPVKPHLLEQFEGSGDSESIGNQQPPVTTDVGAKNTLNKVEHCVKRIEECRGRVDNKFQEFQTEVHQLNKEMDTLLRELRLQSQQQQQQMYNQAQQKQMQQQQVFAQQQQQQQLITAIQAQLAATQQNVAQQQPQFQQQQQQQALIAAVANNQLDMIISEIQAQYSRQLTAQQLLVQLSQLNLLGLPSQDIATLQNIATGSALSEIAHQMSPVTTAPTALHSPLSSVGPQKLSSGPSPVLGTATVSSNCGSVGVQNFLNNLESHAISTGGSTVTSIATPTNVNANLSSVAVEVGHAMSNLGNTATSPTVNNHRHPVGQPVSLTLHQVNQNFTCRAPQSAGTVVPASSASSTGASSSQLTRESTVAEVVAEVASLPTALPRKPFRPRPARTNGAGSKRGGQNIHKQQLAEDPKKQEEIERQIQDIVAIALEVDSAAKYAEKERKTRGGEKRNKEKNVAFSATPVGVLNSIPSTSTSTLSLPTQTTTSAILDKTLPPVIMQNFLTAAVAAQQKHLKQQQMSNLTSSSSTECVNEIRLHTTAGSSIDQQHLAETPNPLSPSTSISIKTHFPFTPSSISLAIQSTGLSGSQFTEANGSKGTSQMATTSEHNTVLPMFLHPKESCSPPFISLNLPPTTSAALVTPPTNVVVKMEPKMPPITTSVMNACKNSLLSASPSTMP